MASYQMKIILKVLFLHVSLPCPFRLRSQATNCIQLRHYPFSIHGIAVPTNAVELLTSKLVCDPIETHLTLAMHGLLTCLNTGKHLSIFDFLVDSYVAVAILNDRNWQDDRPTATNVHVMLKRIREEVIKLIKALVDRHAGVLTGNIMDVDGTFPVSTLSLALLQYLESSD
ncbi:uncharacterized protein K444DRAFT_323031 [Hyaloscypha bicolor E]|uniref:Uncharacterized protein n=1 Tax=Hyaloscypha bicolor E TaxID=1095630 RepID=A0A2J6TKK1_9HELO|nr:uncharacterized protein K444DRAFT_323031 [Hyaloscypha bicolor E]PMD63549.1 hypothetical protein K444DRAFT_323031 [Hyaloscypha bicolor E]